MATQSDDIAALTLLVTRVLAVHGLAEATRMQAGVSLSELAKASGATPEQVGMWIAGKATPTTRQSLAAFSELYARASWREAAGNTPDPAVAAEVEKIVVAPPEPTAAPAKKRGIRR